MKLRKEEAAITRCLFEPKHQKVETLSFAQQFGNNFAFFKNAYT